MKIKLEFCALLFCLAVILMACTGTNQGGHVFRENNGLESEENDNTAAPSNTYAGDITIPGTVHSGINYVSLPDIKPEKVPEIKVEKDMAQCIVSIKPIKKDKFIEVYMSNIPSLPGVKGKQSSPAAIRFDGDGKVMWERHFPYNVFNGTIGALVCFPDGSFAFSVNVFPNISNNEMKYEKSFLIKCDKEGNQLWKLDFDDYSGRMLRDLLQLDNGDIIAVGEWQYSGDKQVISGRDDIVITRINKEGKIVKQKSFGGSDFDNYFTVGYDKEIGIVLCGISQSADGDFAASRDGQGKSYIACIDENLNLRWKYVSEEEEYFLEEPLFIFDECIYKLGYVQNPGKGKSSPVILKLDKNGKSLWTKLIKTQDIWPRILTVLKDGEIVLSMGQPNEGSLVILDKDGEEKKFLSDIGFGADTIMPTEDGGFITVSSRIVSSVPTPPALSSIWYDWEVVAERFDKDYSVLWRKTYDSYKGSTRKDNIVPLEDGRLIWAP